MDYLAFRYTKTRYKVPIEYNKKKKKVEPDEIEEKLKCEGDAIFLSGGIDSSLLAAINKPKMAYFATFPDFDDEKEWAQKVATHIGIPLKLIEITRERYLVSLEYLIRQKGDGLHPNEPCLYLMAREAKKDGCSRIISGEGADGLFGGYTQLLNGDFFKNEKIFRERYLQIDTGVDIPFDIWKEWGMYRFLLEVHTPALIDRATNAVYSAGMEVVFPYLNKGIPQMMWEAFTNQKTDKVILKDIAKKYLLKSVIDRHKIGFPTPWDIKEFLRLNKEIGW